MKDNTYLKWKKEIIRIFDCEYFDRDNTTIRNYILDICEYHDVNKFKLQEIMLDDFTFYGTMDKISKAAHPKAYIKKCISNWLVDRYRSSTLTTNEYAIIDYIDLNKNIDSKTIINEKIHGYIPDPETYFINIGEAAEKKKDNKFKLKLIKNNLSKEYIDYICDDDITQSAATKKLGLHQQRFGEQLSKKQTKIQRIYAETK